MPEEEGKEEKILKRRFTGGGEMGEEEGEGRQKRLKRRLRKKRSTRKGTMAQREVKKRTTTRWQ